MEEEARARDGVSEKLRDIDTAADKAVHDVKMAKEKVTAGVKYVQDTGVEKISDTGKSVGGKLSSQVGQAFVVDTSDPKSGVVDFLEEMKRDAAWDKLHFEEKPDAHIYENVQRSVFVKETTPESKTVTSSRTGTDTKSTAKTVTSSTFGAYDPFSDVPSDLQIRLSEGNITDDDRASESKSKKVSRIPQKVSFSKDVSPSSSTDSAVRVVKVFSEVEHLEPHTRQTVTTVVTKSVRAAATPPPSPAEYTDSRIEGILQ